MAHISIVTLDGRHQDASVLRALDTIWREAGHKVEVGTTFAPDAEVALLHRDISVIEPDTVPPAPDGVRLINGRALDIRKRGYSTLQISPDSDWDGPVLIKTDLNNFGTPEANARAWSGRKVFEWLRTELGARNWRLAHKLVGKYPVLQHLREVPGWVWRNPDYLVERFMPERDGDRFCLRGWMFLGQRSYGWRLFASDPMVKTGSMLGYEFLETIPPELEDVRRRCNLDFGKIDYVVHDGRAIVLDANKTPFFSGDPNSPRLQELARGIEDFLS